MQHTDELFYLSLVPLLTERVGFTAESLNRRNILRTAAHLKRKGVHTEDILRQLVLGDAELIELFEQAALVHETTWFRQQEHFEFLYFDHLPALMRTKPQTIKVWSAGCATGEEPYSLAALFRHFIASNLRDKNPPIVDILGTDLSAPSLDKARKGKYTQKLTRNSDDFLWPVMSTDSDLEHGNGQGFEVDQNLRDVTRFEKHNLLSPRPKEDGLFDIILCRNVLIYFALHQQPVVIQNLLAALKPGGIILFAPVDICATPPGTHVIGPKGLQVFQKDRSQAPQKDFRSGFVKIPTEKPQLSQVVQEHMLPRDSQAIHEHLLALSEIEKQNPDRAAIILDKNMRTHPDYLPGYLELLLLEKRRGRFNQAKKLGLALLEKLSAIPSDELLPGPELLSAGFYRTTTQATLASLGGYP